MKFAELTQAQTSLDLIARSADLLNHVVGSVDLLAGILAEHHCAGNALCARLALEAHLRVKLSESLILDSVGRGLEESKELVHKGLLSLN